MTPERLTECLAIIGWPRLMLARKLGRQQTTVERWAKGLYPIPAAEAAWIEKLAAYHLKHPPPAIETRRKTKREAA